MPRTRIKICGIQTVEAALAAAVAGADAIGLVFEPKSPRAVDVAQAKVIVQRLPAFVEPVGLFVNQPAERVREIAAAVGLSSVQLHGKETPEDVVALADQRVIKALPFEPDDLESVMATWRPVAGYLNGLLLDTPPKKEAGALTGGSGHAFDWQALADAQKSGAFDGLPPVVVAGGLNPENVGDAIRQTKPYAVDVSSGVERERGVKDLVRIAQFCQAVQQADAV